MKPPSFSTGELMACVGAHQLEDGRSVFVGTGLPMIATMLAQRTHAPSLTLIFEAGIIASQVIRLPISVADTRASHLAMALSSMHDVMSLCQNGYIDYGFLGAASIDVYGNINTTVYGDWAQPLTRLPGSGGANDIGSLCWRTIILMRQEPRRFLKKLPFLTTPGYLNGPGAREEAGLPSGTGPWRVITQLGLYDFDPVSRQLRLLSRHPGVSLDDIAANSEFDIVLTPDVPVTASPTDDELAILRKIDPLRKAIG